jgi:hypothetical protein
LTAKSAVRATRKNLKLWSDVCDSGNKKYNFGYGNTFGGVRRGLQSGGLASLAAFDRNMAPEVFEMFSHLIYAHFIKTLTFHFQ